MPSALQNEIRRLMAERHLSMAAWARQAGLKPTYVRDILRADHPNPSAEGLKKLALALNLPPGHFSEVDVSRNSQLHSNNDVRFIDPHTVRNQTVEMPRDVPVIRAEVSARPESGDFVMSGVSGAFVRRPLHMADRDDIRAIYVQTDRVKHRYPVGELLLLERLKPPTPGEFAVIALNALEDGTDSAPAYLGEVAAITAAKVTLRQSNPVKTFDVDRKKIAVLYRVIPLAEILGG